jgi:hypothetical protein
LGGRRSAGRKDGDVWFARIVAGTEERLQLSFVGPILDSALTGTEWYERMARWAETAPYNIAATIRRTGKRLQNIRALPGADEIVDEDILDITYLDNRPAMILPAPYPGPPPEEDAGDEERERAREGAHTQHRHRGQ